MKKFCFLILLLIATNYSVYGSSGNWEEHRNTQWGADYDEKDLFDICTAEDLAQLAWLVSFKGKTFENKTVSLTPLSGNEIDLSLHWWSPIGAHENHFCGVFNGNGNTLSGLKINMPDTDYTGFFSVLGAEGSIRDLHIKVGPKGITGGNRAAGLVAGCYGKIHNCSVEGAFVIAKGYSVGGLVGSAYPGSEIKNCTTNIPVEAANVHKLHAGGLVGYQDGCAITKCRASGSVTLRNADTSDAGGLVGYRKSGSIKNSRASGILIIESSTATSSGKITGRKVSH